MRRLATVVVAVSACITASCAQTLGEDPFEQQLAIYTCEQASDTGFSPGEPVLRSDAQGLVSAFRNLHDGRQLFLFGDNSDTLPPQQVPTNCLQPLTGFSTYHPSQEVFVPLEQSADDREALGEMEFSREWPSVYVRFRQDGSFEQGMHSDDRVDDSKYASYFKLAGKLFSDGKYIVGKSAVTESMGPRRLYFVARRVAVDRIDIVGATELPDSSTP